MDSSVPKDAVIAWEGDSKEVISSFPNAVKYNLGFELRLLQQGQQATDYRPMSSIGPGVFELRDQDERAWYRVIYLSRVHDMIHVLHCFEKRSREKPRDADEGDQYSTAAAQGSSGQDDPGEEAWRAVSQLT